MTNKDYFGQFGRYTSLAREFGSMVGGDPAVSCLTPEQQEEVILRDLLKAIRSGMGENRVRSLKNAKPRIEIQTLPFRKREYGRVFMIARRDGLYVLANNGERWFRYGDVYEFFRVARRTNKPTTWEPEGFAVRLMPEGLGLVKIDDRFEFNQEQVTAFLEKRLLTLGSLIVTPVKGGTIHLDVRYRGVPVLQHLRDARLHFESQEVYDRIVELFGEKIATAATYLEVS